MSFTTRKTINFVGTYSFHDGKENQYFIKQSIGNKLIFLVKVPLTPQIFSNCQKCTFVSDNCSEKIFAIAFLLDFLFAANNSSFYN